MTHTDVTDVGSVGPMSGIGGSDGDTGVSGVKRRRRVHYWGLSDACDIGVPNIYILLLYT